MANVYTAPGVYVEEAPAAAPIVGVGTSTAAFIGVWKGTPGPDPGHIIQCTTFTDFKLEFGEIDTKDPTGRFAFSATNPAQNLLAHAVNGFFTNGGTRCYVAKADEEGTIKAQVLEKLEAYDDVSMIVAPGVPTDPSKADAVTDIVAHCAGLGDRFAILDAPKVANPAADLKEYLPGGSKAITQATDFAALYTPWFIVHDPASKEDNKEKAVPPSGHVAGVYARTDATRGVHKAPANEQVFGVIRPETLIGRPQQAAINLLGANCIRNMNGAIKVWGARTLAGDGSLHKYVPIRRLLSFLYKSIDHGTQWAVFEPNNSDLWARIIRNVSSFLTSMWAQGALAGNVPQEAFYVKCDAENNPPDQRANGLLVVEVGVATVFPAEFVVFRIQQYTGPIK